MSKFNRPIPAPRPDAVTAQGGEGFTRPLLDELFLLGVANVVGESTFYEAADVRDKRFVDLVHAATKADPDWVRSFAGWLRSEGQMRSASVVVAAEYVRAGGPNARQVVSSVLQRPDEPAELLSYWLSKHGRPIKIAMDRGISDALGRLYTEHNVLRYDGQNKVMRFADVIELVRPKPQDDHQSALFRALIDRRHSRSEIDYSMLPILAEDVRLQAIPEQDRKDHLSEAVANGWSWERTLAWVGNEPGVWEAIIPNMGLMALTRNLRNFDQAGLGREVVDYVEAKLSDPEEVRKSRQFPIRFLSAWKNVKSMRWGPALEQALEHSVSNVPHFPGKTLVLIDVSGSMGAPAIGNRRGTGESPLRWEVAALFGLAVAKRSDAAKVYTFNTSVAEVRFGQSDSILRTAQSLRMGGGTDTLGAILNTYDTNFDRIVIVTDEQTGTRGSWERAVKAVRCPVFTWNLAGYRYGHTPDWNQWHHFGGLSDASFRLIPALESRVNNRWPWE